MMKIPDEKFNLADEFKLREVVTLPEAVAMFGTPRTTLLFDILKGKVTGRKSVGTWLVTVSSCIAVYGVPQNPMQEYE